MTEPSDEARVFAEEAIYGAGPKDSLKRVTAALQKLIDERDRFQGLYEQLQKNCLQMADSRAVQEQRAEAAEKALKQEEDECERWHERTEAAEQRVAALEAKCDLLAASLKQADAKAALAADWSDAVEDELRGEGGEAPDFDAFVANWAVKRGLCTIEKGAVCRAWLVGDTFSIRVHDGAEWKEVASVPNAWTRTQVEP